MIFLLFLVLVNSRIYEQRNFHFHFFSLLAASLTIRNKHSNICNQCYAIKTPCREWMANYSLNPFFLVHCTALSLKAISGK